MSPEPLIGVTVTAREIYDGLVRLTGRVDVLIEQTNQSMHVSQDHEGRIRALEKARWPLPSVAVLLSVLSLIAVFVIR